MHRLAIIILIGIFSFIPYTFAKTIQVPADYRAIQTAIDSAAIGDTVLVAPGVYNENIDFHGKRLVLASYFLTTSDTSYISQTIIDGNADSSVVSFQNKEPEGTALIGLSIRNGLGTGDWPNVRGGGIHLEYNAKPLIRYCYIYNNETTGSSNRGGGINTKNGAPTISNCKIYNNKSFIGSAITVGNGAAEVLIDSCEIFNNIGFQTVLLAYSENVTIRRTVIRHNSGGALRSYSTNNTRLIQSTIFANQGFGIEYSGVSATVRDTFYVFNSIVFANTDVNYISEGSLFIVRYSLIEGAADSVWFGEGCLDTDPLFSDSLTFLSVNSPVINAGDPALAADPDGTVADMGAYYYKDPTMIDENKPKFLSRFALGQNYPNPFNPATKITYELPVTKYVEVSVFNVLGQKVGALVNKEQKAGSHSVVFNGHDLASGVYFYQLQVGGQSQIRKMLLVK